MKALWVALRKIVLTTVVMLFLTMISCIALAMFLGPPIALLAESFEMVGMRSTARGKIDGITIKRGSKGTSRARISYSFAVGGQQFQSDRYLPGFLANHASWTGGSTVAADYQVGQPITVNFNKRNPSWCALEYGWFKVSVASTAIIWGMVITGCAQQKHVRRRYCNWLSLAGVASLIYGFALLFLGPTVVRPVELHWHALSWSAALTFVVVYRRLQPRFAQQSHPLEPAAGPDSNGEPSPPAQ